MGARRGVLVAYPSRREEKYTRRGSLGAYSSKGDGGVARRGIWGAYPSKGIWGAYPSKGGGGGARLGEFGSISKSRRESGARRENLGLYIHK